MIRLAFIHRYFIYLIWGLLTVTGCYFAYVQDWQMQLPTNLTVVTLKLHGIAAAIMLILLGSLMTVHIKLSLRSRRNIVTGLGLLSFMLVLSLTGTGLYYSPEDWHEMVKWIHIWVGLIVTVVLPLHIIVGRRLRYKASILNKG